MVYRRMPLIDRFRRFVERLLPERGSPLTRCLRLGSAGDPNCSRGSSAANGCTLARNDVRINCRSVDGYESWSLCPC